MIRFIQSIRGKVFLMVLPPILALTALATFHAVDRSAHLTRINHLTRLSDLAVTAGDAIQAFQAERSAAVLFLNAPSDERLAALKASREAGVHPLERLAQDLRSHEKSAETLRVLPGQTTAALELLRRRVDARAASVPEALEGYGTQISNLLEWHKGLLKSTVGTPLESRLRALSTLQDLEEQVSIEGATVEGSFGFATLPPGFAEGFLAQRGAQQAVAHALMELLDDSERPVLHSILQGPGSQVLGEQRRQVEMASRLRAPGADEASRWMEADSARWRALQAFEARLAVSLRAQAQALKSQAIRSLVLVLLGTLALQVFLIAFAWALSRHITRPMELLASAMARLQEGDLTQELPAEGGDEVTRMALAFNHMSAHLRTLHSQLIRAARELAEGSRTLIANAERVNETSARLAQGALQEREHADHMTGAVHDLSASIDQVRRQMDEALEKTRLLKALAERGEQASLAGESEGELLGRAFRAMIGIVREVDLRAAEIHLATEDQSRCNRTVSDRVNEVNQQARQTLQAASQLANAAPEVLFTAKGLHRLAEDLAKHASAFQV